MDGHGGNDIAGLAPAYRFLQRLFLEPDERFWRFLAQNGEPLAEVGIVVGKDLNYQLLREEYTRLFLGPFGHFPPYESVFVEGRFWGASAVWVRDFAAAVGFTISPDFRMPPDHVAVEMEILELLLTNAAPTAPAYYARFFYERTPWLKDFIPLVSSKATLAFYREAFAFATSFLRREEERLMASTPGRCSLGRALFAP